MGRARGSGSCAPPSSPSREESCAGESLLRRDDAPEEPSDAVASVGPPCDPSMVSRETRTSASRRSLAIAPEWRRRAARASGRSAVMSTSTAPPTECARTATRPSSGTSISPEAAFRSTAWLATDASASRRRAPASAPSTGSADGSVTTAKGLAGPWAEGVAGTAANPATPATAASSFGAPSASDRSVESSVADTGVRSLRACPAGLAAPDAPPRAPARGTPLDALGRGDFEDIAKSRRPSGLCPQGGVATKGGATGAWLSAAGVAAVGAAVDAEVPAVGAEVDEWLADADASCAPGPFCAPADETSGALTASEAGAAAEETWDAEPPEPSAPNAAWLVVGVVVATPRAGGPPSASSAASPSRAARVAASAAVPSVGSDTRLAALPEAGGDTNAPSNAPAATGRPELEGPPSASSDASLTARDTSWVTGANTEVASGGAALAA